MSDIFSKVFVFSDDILPSLRNLHTNLFPRSFPCRCSWGWCQLAGELVEPWKVSTTSESTRSKPDFHQVDRTAVLQALLWDSKSSKEVAMWDGPEFLSIFFGFCSTVSKIVVKIFQVIIIYTYRYSIQCTYTFITVLYVWKKKHARSLEACNLLMRLKKSSSLTW